MTPRECWPPEGTPDGTVCVLTRFAAGRRTWVWQWSQMMWFPYPRDPRDTPLSPAEMARNGWRIAEPPHE